MIVRFPCGTCHRVARFDASAPPDEISCARCTARVRPEVSEAVRSGSGLDVCPVCAKAYFYREKDFNGWIGGAVLVAAAVGFLVMADRNLWIAMGILGAAALLDLVVYLIVPFRYVCYNCLASFHGAPDVASIGPYDLGVAGRFADDYEAERSRKRE